MPVKKRPCTTFPMLEIRPKSNSATVVLLEIGDISKKAKTCPKHRAQPCCCSKLASTHTAQLSFCFKLACAKHRAQLFCCSKFASKHSAQPSFCLKLARIVRKPKPVKNAVHKFPFARYWPQNHSAQLSVCLKWATFLNKLQLV